MPQPYSRTFQARHALLRYLAPRYQQASPVQKTLLLDAFVEWTGYTRKYAIELLNHGKQDQQTIQRHRLPQYGPAAQQALFLAWKAAHYVCAKGCVAKIFKLIKMMHIRKSQRVKRVKEVPLLSVNAFKVIILWSILMSLKIFATQPSAALLQFRSVLLHPTIDGCVINVQTSFEHYLLQVAVTERISQVPAHTYQDDLGFKMTPFEGMLLVHEGYSSAFLEYSRVYQNTIVFATQPFFVL